ncbi:MAG: hypothetical protein M0Q52_11610 [Lascolabacillus sp.]|nr:hypothetical protein [Lascolabacillus sp.]
MIGPASPDTRSQKTEDRGQKEFAASLAVEAADPGGNPIGVGWGEPANPNNSDRLRWALRAHPNLRDSHLAFGHPPGVSLCSHTSLGEGNKHLTG